MYIFFILTFLKIKKIIHFDTKCKGATLVFVQKTLENLIVEPKFKHSHNFHKTRSSSVNLNIWRFSSKKPKNMNEAIGLRTTKTPLLQRQQKIHQKWYIFWGGV